MPTPSTETAAAGGHPGDDAQDDETEDVVDDRRADDDPGFLGGHAPQIGEDTGGDADGSGGERCADEDRLGDAIGAGNGARVRQVGPVGETEGEGHRHTDGGDGKGCGSDAKHLAQVGFEADLEEQQQHAELGEHVDHLAGRPFGRDDAEDAAAQEDAGHQLAEDGGLADALGELAEELGSDEHGGDRQEEASDVHAAGATSLQRLLDLRSEFEGVLEEWEVHTVAVLGVNGDPVASLDLERQGAAKQ